MKMRRLSEEAANAMASSSRLRVKHRTPVSRTRSPKSHTHLAMVCPQPALGATGCAGARSSSAHPPLRAAAACARSERGRTPHPPKPARPSSAGRRDHRGLVGWQWWALRCCAQATAPRLAAWPRQRITHPAGGRRRLRAARRAPWQICCEARFSRFSRSCLICRLVARSGSARPAQPQRLRGRAEQQRPGGAM